MPDANTRHLLIQLKTMAVKQLNHIKGATQTFSRRAFHLIYHRIGESIYYFIVTFL